MKRKSSEKGTSVREHQPTPAEVAEGILGKRIAEIATVISASDAGKSRLYDEILAMVERSLFRIALERSNHIKSAAAAYLGINRNTFQNKMIKLGINNHEE